MKSSKITIEIGLDDQKIPESIHWTADQKPNQKPQAAKALMLALFDADTKDTMRIDLWTKEMQIMEMDRFYYHALRSMADRYIKATGNKNMANAMQQFATYFGEETNIIPKTQ